MSASSRSVVLLLPLLVGNVCGNEEPPRSPSQVRFHSLFPRGEHSPPPSPLKCCMTSTRANALEHTRIGTWDIHTTASNLKCNTYCTPTACWTAAPLQGARLHRMPPTLWYVKSVTCHKDHARIYCHSRPAELGWCLPWEMGSWHSQPRVL